MSWLGKIKDILYSTLDFLKVCSSVKSRNKWFSTTRTFYGREDKDPWMLIIWAQPSGLGGLPSCVRHLTLHSSQSVQNSLPPDSAGKTVTSLRAGVLSSLPCVIRRDMHTVGAFSVLVAQMSAPSSPVKFCSSVHSFTENPHLQQKPSQIPSVQIFFLPCAPMKYYCLSIVTPALC